MIRKLINLFLLIIAVISLVLFINGYIDRKKSIESYDSVREQFYKKSNDINSINSKLQNPDIIGWIKISGTNIDYPIAKTSDNSFYLNHNILKETDPAGSIFIDYRIDITKNTKHILLYGHNMKNGTMFNNLNKFKDKSFLNQNQIININLNNENTTWKIFSIVIADTKFDYTKVFFINDKDFNDFVSTLKDKSLYSTGLQVTNEDEILTLSTCDYDFKDARLIISAKKIK